MSLLSEHLDRRVELEVTHLSSLPRVDLLPTEIVVARRFRRVQNGLSGLVVLSVLIVVCLFVLASQDASKAHKSLAAEQATDQTLQAQTVQYAEVPRINDEVAAADADLSTATAQEVRWSFYLNDLSLRIPSGVWLTDMTMGQDVGADVNAAPPEPGTFAALPDRIGEITFTGKALSHDDVARWLESLAKQKGYQVPYFTAATKAEVGGRQIVEFTSTVEVTNDALSLRAQQLTGTN
jgi:Tfp pilus assembly protein PilN